VSSDEFTGLTATKFLQSSARVLAEEIAHETQKGSEALSQWKELKRQSLEDLKKVCLPGVYRANYLTHNCASMLNYVAFGIRKGLMKRKRNRRNFACKKKIGMSLATLAFTPLIRSSFQNYRALEI